LFFCLGHKRSKRSSQTEGFFAALALAHKPYACLCPQNQAKPGLGFYPGQSRSRPVLSENPEALQPHLPDIVLHDFLPKLTV
jgi:hypothetical protein